MKRFTERLHLGDRLRKDNISRYVLQCGLAGLAMFVMVVTRTEHPPAAALSLGPVRNEWDVLTLLVVIGGIVALSIIKRLVLPILMDLL